MNRQVKIVMSTTLLMALGMIGSKWYHTPTATAQSTQAPIALPARWSYAAKFVCGFQPFGSNPPNENAVKVGNYATVINIHNPWQTVVVLQKKVVVAFRESFPNTVPTDPTRRFQDKLVSDHAMSVDCTEIVNLLTINGTPPAATFIEGYVVIDSYFPAGAANTAAPVDVVEVTSAAPNEGAGVASHNVMTVVGRQLPAGTWPF